MKLINKNYKIIVTKILHEFEFNLKEDNKIKKNTLKEIEGYLNELLNDFDIFKKEIKEYNKEMFDLNENLSITKNELQKIQNNFKLCLNLLDDHNKKLKKINDKENNYFNEVCKFLLKEENLNYYNNSIKHEKLSQIMDKLKIEFNNQKIHNNYTENNIYESINFDNKNNYNFTFNTPKVLNNREEKIFSNNYNNHSSLNKSEKKHVALDDILDLSSYKISNDSNE